MLNIGIRLAAIITMARVFILIFASLFTSILYSSPETGQINNWDDLTKTQKIKASDLVSSIYKKNSDVLDEFKIPTDMTYYSTNLSEQYGGKYPNNKKATVIVGYVPLQFVEHYESQLQRSYEEKSTLNNVPKLDTLLAIHYTESKYVTNAIGGTDVNPSFGLPQLTLNSAKDLYRMDKETYEQFYAIDGHKISFGSTKKQIAFTIKFLTDVKMYSRRYEIASIRSYNGEGKDTIKYAALVLNRARLYKKMRAHGKDIDRQKFIATYATAEVKDSINNQLEAKEYPPLSDGEFKEAVEKALLVYEYDGTSSDDTTLPAIENKEISKPASTRLNFPPIPDDGCAYYVKIEEGRTLFSYFSNMKDMVYTVCNQKNDQYALYYNTKTGKKALKSLYDIDLKNSKMQTDVKAGDVIYLPVDMIIKGNKQTLMNLSRICP